MLGSPILTPMGDVRQKLVIQLISHGVKNDQPLPKAEHYIDCRGIANPYHAPGVGSGTGDDPSIQQWVREHTNVSPYVDQVLQAFSRLTTRRGEGAEFEKPFIICTMCAHGIHRSRAMKHILGGWLKGAGFLNVEVK